MKSFGLDSQKWIVEVAQQEIWSSCNPPEVFTKMLEKLSEITGMPFRVVAVDVHDAVKQELLNRVLEEQK